MKGRKATEKKEAGTGSPARRILEVAQKHRAEIVDLKFTDLFGLWQHFSIPVSEVSGSLFEEGIGFDGSSIRGFQKIHESDMILIPDSQTAFPDPACEIPTISVTCDVYDPVTRKPYSRDPRYIARKAEEFLKSSGLADVCHVGPEVEFFIFDEVRYEYREHTAFHLVDSSEGAWNTARPEGPNLGYKQRWKEGYFPAPPRDALQDVRSEMVLRLMEAGVPVEVHHHEVATAGQAEIDMRYQNLLRMADQVMIYKHVAKNVARRRGKVATFMPKPLFADNGSGMHTHQSLWKGGKNLFYDPKGYALISETCRYYIGGLLRHARALAAFCSPSTNSYRRLVPGFEAPVNLVYSQRNRSAAVRIPVYTANPAAKRIEYRPPDPSCNPYLAFSAMLMAGLDGIAKKMDPGEPLDEDIYELPPEKTAKIPTLPGSLEEALRALEEDHNFLLAGKVFTEDVLETWISWKRSKEVDPIRLRPHPYEFQLYFDV